MPVLLESKIQSFGDGTGIVFSQGMAQALDLYCWIRGVKDVEYPARVSFEAA